ncbi:MAG: dihydroorotase [Flavobacteriales bacterium]
MKYLIRNAEVVNEMKRFFADVLIDGELIVDIAPAHSLTATDHTTIIDATGKLLIPGLIDDQVHFREPGLMHKGEIATESAAAVAGGITSYMEMPNTKPPATTIDLLEEKYSRAAECSPANYSFFMGTSNDNLDELLKIDPKKVCGIKIFMGSSTGNMLVDDETILNRIFSSTSMLIALHCEKDPIIAAALAAFQKEHGRDPDITYHGVIRGVDACYASSSQAVEIATRHNTRLHILHISTEKELSLFTNRIPLTEKRITSEACIHHLYFTQEDYARLGHRIKWNPSVKTATDRAAIRAAVNDDRIDVIATDHAPHSLEEKALPYLQAPSGGPLVQHSLLALLQLYHQGVFSLENIVRKTSHAVADMFCIDRRGYIRKGYFADLVLVDLEQKTHIEKAGLLYKCGWSPFEGETWKGAVIKTWVNGNLVYSEGKVSNETRGKRLMFNR